MKVFLLLGLFVAAVAAAPKDLKKDDDSLSQLPQVAPESALLPEPELPVIVPEPVVLPEPELPVIVPEPVVLPEPELPVIIPDSVVLPEPELPVIVPDSVVLPEPELPVIIPDSVVLPEPQLPVVVPDSVVLPEPVFPEVQLPIVIPAPAPNEEDFQPLPQPPSQPQIPNGEIFNDGIVQISVNAPEDAGVLSSIHNWMSMVLNYISNGIQSSYHIIG